MDIFLTEAQSARRREAIEFAERELSGDVEERYREGRFARELWSACARFGILGLSVPPEYSPHGRPPDILESVLVMQGLGYGCPDAGLLLGLNAQIWTVTLPIVQFGTEEQKRRFLPGLADGSTIGAHAVTEPDAGSDAYALTTVAERVDGGYRLRGTKRFITLGPVADVALVFATIDPSKGRWGLTAFLVERGEGGFRAGPVLEKMGLRTVPFSELHFEDCFVPEEQRLGPEGAGGSIANHSLEFDRCCILASQLGAMERQLDQTIRYAKERRQFGQPIGKFQSVSNRIVDMKLRFETARLLLWQAASKKSRGGSAMLESSLLKLHLGESFVESSLDAIRVHGGNGYLEEFGVARDLRDAVGGVIYAGTSDIQRNIVARLLGL